jgi:hypothetical protein
MIAEFVSKSFKDNTMVLIKMLVQKELKYFNFFHQFVLDVALEPLKNVELEKFEYFLFNILLDLSKNKEFDKIFRILVQNKTEVNNDLIVTVCNHFKKCNGNQLLYVLRRVEKMKKNILTLEQATLGFVLNAAAEKSQQSLEVIARFSLDGLTFQNFSLFA